MLLLLYAIAWLTVLNGKEPTMFGNDIDTGVRPVEHVLLHQFKYFFST